MLSEGHMLLGADICVDKGNLLQKFFNFEDHELSIFQGICKWWEKCKLVTISKLFYKGNNYFLSYSPCCLRDRVLSMISFISVAISK